MLGASCWVRGAAALSTPVRAPSTEHAAHCFSNIVLMASATCTTHDSLQSTLVERGFALVHAAAMRQILGPFGPLSHCPRFADSWNAPQADTYMPDGGRHPRRRPPRV